MTRRRTVAARLLASYVIVLAAFAVTVGWSVLGLRRAARDAELIRAGYVPLLIRIDQSLAEQNVVTAQLNHVTSAKNPADVREWLGVARRARPASFLAMREAAEAGLSRAAPLGSGSSIFFEEAATEIGAIEKLLTAEPERFQRLFTALGAGDLETAERTRNELTKREAEGAQRLGNLKDRLVGEMAKLTTAAEARERLSMGLLVALGAFTLLVGVATSLYARRVLAPLSRVTDRAKVVAEGDLTPREVVASNDEIGELATTFEAMVAAIQRARSELVQAERLATIGKMAAHITHEVRNPLSSIGLNVELLEEEIGAAGAPNAEAAALVSAIKSEVDRLSRIAEQYLSVARRPKPKLVREKLDDLVRELVLFVEPELAKSRVTARVETEAGMPEVELDEGQIRQAVLNLVRNAREAMPEGGQIAVIARTRDPDAAEIIVEDNGVGIPEDVLQNVFDPFFTTKARGTGLGLAVTREIVDAHGGHIACERRAEGGTRFRIWLPRSQPGYAAAP